MFRFLRQLLVTLFAWVALFTAVVALGVWYFAPNLYGRLWDFLTDSLSAWFFDPNNAFTLTLRIILGVLAVLSAWAIIANVLRTTWVIIARTFGLYDMAHFHEYLKFSPPWRAVRKVLIPVILWWRNLGFGQPPASRPAGLIETAANVYRPDEIPVGRFAPFGIPAFQPVSVKGERHVCIVAAPGSGKTVTICSIVSQEKGNVMVFDVDGQIIHALGHSIEARGKKVIKLDPFNLVPGFPGGCINFLDELAAAEKRHGRDAIVAFAKVLADSLIQVYDRRNEWVYNQARLFMQALLIFVYLYEERKDMVRVRELLTVGLKLESSRPQDDLFMTLLWAMLQKTEDLGGIIAKGAACMLSSQEKDGKNHPRTSAIEQTSWLDLPEMTAISRHSDFHCEDLKMGNICLFINAPLTDIQKQLSGWCRVLSEMMMYAFQRITDYRPANPMLFIAEELPSLGRLEVLETAIPGFRKYGLKVVAVMQNLEKLQAVYPQTWGTFLGDAECVIWMKTAHRSTIEYLSKVLGQFTRVEKIKGGLFSRLGPRIQQEERQVQDYAGLERFLDRNIIVTRANQRPLFLKPLRYYEELPVWQYQPDRFYGETKLRAFTRRMIDRLRRFHERMEERGQRWFDRMEYEMTHHPGYLLPSMGIFWVSLFGSQLLKASFDSWLEWLILRIVGVISVIALIGSVLFFFYAHLREAYRKASAVFDKSLDYKHPYRAEGVRLFGSIFLLAVAGWSSIVFTPTVERVYESVGLICAGLYGLTFIVIGLSTLNFTIFSFPCIGMIIYASAFATFVLLIGALRAFRRAYDWLADKAMWHTLCATKRFPDRQRGIIRWLAERYPERYQKAVLKARRVAEARRVLRQKPLA